MGLAAIVLAVVAVLGIRASSRATGRTATLVVPAGVGGDNVSPSDRDASLSRLAVGVWRDNYQGKRTLTLRSDGTATMVVELSGIKARLFTPRLELDIVWSIRDGKMHRRTVGGRPADKVEFVNRRAGVAVAEPIVELTENRMVLLDQSGARRYHWRRAR